MTRQTWIKTLGWCGLLLGRVWSAEGQTWKGAYDLVFPVSEGVHRVIKDRKTGFCDAAGKAIIAPQYRMALDFDGQVAPVEIGGKWGLVDKANKQVMAPVYNQVRDWEENGLMEVGREGLYGVLNNKGVQVLEPKYDEVQILKKFILVRKNGRYYAHNLEGKQVIDFKEYIPDAVYEDDAFVVKTAAEGYGLMDTEGKIIIPLRYLELSYPTKGTVVVTQSEGKGLLDYVNNKMLTPLEYSFMVSVEQGYWIGNKDSRYRLLNSKGEAVLPVEYDRLRFISDEEIFVEQKREFMLMNLQGEVLQTYPYNLIEPYYDDILKVTTKEWNMGFIDKTGKVLLAPVFPRAWLRSADVVEAQNVDGLWGVVDLYGRTIVPFIYDRVNVMADYGVIQVQKGEKWGILDFKNQVIAAIEFEDFPRFLGFWIDGGEWVGVGRGGKYGYVNMWGEEMLPFRYDEVRGFREGLAAVRQGEVWGFIDETGKWVIEPMYEYAETFDDGLAQVQWKGKYGIIDKKGKWVLAAEYDEFFRRQSFEYFSAIKEGKHGIIDCFGKVIVPFEWDNLDEVQGHYIAQKDGKEGVMNKQGKILIPAIYDDLRWWEGSLFSAKLDGKFGLVNFQHQVILPLEYKRIDYFSYEKQQGVATKQDGTEVKIDGRGKCVEHCD